MVCSVTANSGAQGACEAGQRRLRVRGAGKSVLVGSGEATAGLRTGQRRAAVCWERHRAGT